MGARKSAKSLEALTGRDSTRKLVPNTNFQASRKSGTAFRQDSLSRPKGARKAGNGELGISRFLECCLQRREIGTRRARNHPQTERRSGVGLWLERDSCKP